MKKLGGGGTHVTRKKTHVTSKGDFRSLKWVEYHVTIHENNKLVSEKASCRRLMFHELLSYPKLRTIWGVTEFTAL